MAAQCVSTQRLTNSLVPPSLTVDRDLPQCLNCGQKGDNRNKDFATTTAKKQRREKEGPTDRETGRRTRRRLPLSHNTTLKSTDDGGVARKDKLRTNQPGSYSAHVADGVKREQSPIHVLHDIYLNLLWKQCARYYYSIWQLLRCLF